MKIFYVHLPVLEGFLMNDYSHVHWGKGEKKLLKSKNMVMARIEGRSIVREHLEKQTTYIDSRFTKEERERLERSIPKTIQIVKEATYDYSLNSLF